MVEKKVAVPVKKKPAKKNAEASSSDQPKKKVPVKKKAPGGTRTTGSSSTSTPTSTSTSTSPGAVPKKKAPVKKHPAKKKPGSASSPVKKNKGPITRNAANKIAKPSAAQRPRQKPNDGFVAGDEDDPFANADPSKWRLKELKFGGSSRYEKKGKEEKVVGKSLTKAIKKFKNNPKQYYAMLFQASMLEEQWPDDQCEYCLVHRHDTKMYQPQNVSPTGWMTIYIQEYEALPPYKNNILPEKFRDKYTDNMTFRGRKLHSKSNPPLLPGRGMGICDAPNIKVIGDVDPSDIHQGQVGDCWMLSGISSLAEFDGAIKRLFRKTPGLDKMPTEGKPNKYIITYWDLTTWTEVDIEIDERLAAAPNGGLLASKPSDDGELWACYLEKAFAIHAGGWDRIVGGQCAHAWAVMTGCKYQYTIQPSPGKKGRWFCAMRYNPREKKWGKHGNSPHDCDDTFYEVDWPKVGGGGHGDITEDELFEKMCAWDDVNYIVGAGTTGSSDTNTTEGMVDNHAYSVISCHNDVAGTPIDLIQVRNPWGKGEIEDGEFDDDGPGWDKWPQVKAELNPVVADDGIFYVTPKEFFKFFGSIYVSASDMTQFLED